MKPSIRLQEETKMSSTKLPRRAAMMRLAGAASAAAAAWACGGDTPTSPSATTTTTTGTTGAAGTGTVSTNGQCATTPSETAGPFPSTVSIIRSDIRENRQGVPLSLAIKVVNVNNGCAPVTGAFCSEESQRWMSLIGPVFVQTKSSAKTVGYSLRKISMPFVVVSGYCTNLVAFVFGQSAIAGVTARISSHSIARTKRTAGF